MIVFLPKYAARRLSEQAGPCSCPYTKSREDQCENCNTFWNLVAKELEDEQV